jgi:hypothetical protein
LVAKPSREIRRSIRASAIYDNDFGARRSLAKMLKKRAYQLRLIVNRNDNGELHSRYSKLFPRRVCLAKQAGCFFYLMQKTIEERITTNEVQPEEFK